MKVIKIVVPSGGGGYGGGGYGGGGGGGYGGGWKSGGGGGWSSGGSGWSSGGGGWRSGGGGGGWKSGMLCLAIDVNMNMSFMAFLSFSYFDKAEFKFNICISKSFCILSISFYSISC